MKLEPIDMPSPHKITLFALLSAWMLLFSTSPSTAQNLPVTTGQETAGQETTEQEITEQEITEQEITEQEITEQEITEQEITEQETTEQNKNTPIKIAYCMDCVPFHFQAFHLNRDNQGKQTLRGA